MRSCRSSLLRAGNQFVGGRVCSAHPPSSVVAPVGSARSLGVSASSAAVPWERSSVSQHSRVPTPKCLKSFDEQPMQNGRGECPRLVDAPARPLQTATGASPRQRRTLRSTPRTGIAGTSARAAMNMPVESRPVSLRVCVGGAYISACRDRRVPCPIPAHTRLRSKDATSIPTACRGLLGRDSARAGPGALAMSGGSGQTLTRGSPSSRLSSP